MPEILPGALGTKQQKTAESSRLRKSLKTLKVEVKAQSTVH
jgi:hypothetical protein